MRALFAKISPASARLGTLLARRARGLAFQAGGMSWTFSHGGAGGAVHGVAAYGRLGQSEFSLWLDEPGWRTAAAAALAVRPEDADALPPTLLQAGLECFFSEALAGLEKTLGLPLSLSRFEVRPVPRLVSAWSFRLVRRDGLALSGAWTAAEGDWREAMEKALARAAPPSGDLPGALRLEGVVAAGDWRLAAGALAGLEKGDVVLSPGAAAWSLTVGRRCRFAAVFGKGKLVADGKSASDADAAAAPGREAAPLAALDAAEVELRAEVGRISVALSELRRLSVGEVVEFPASLDAPATLVAGGRAVAFGEVVDVGGRVGVRITALAEEKREANA